MTEEKKGDGLLIGIIAALVLLLMIGVCGGGTLFFVRYSAVRAMQAEQQALEAAERAAAAEAAAKDAASREHAASEPTAKQPEVVPDATQSKADGSTQQD